MAYEELTVSVVANQDGELRTVIGALVQELEDQYIVIEREGGDLGVLNAADLAWLPYGKALADLDQYFLPTYKLDGANLTADEIDDEVDAHSDKVVLLYEGDDFQKLVVAPSELGGGFDGPCKRVRCQNCRRRVVLCGHRRKCPVCGENAV